MLLVREVAVCRAVRHGYGISLQYEFVREVSISERVTKKER